MAYDSIKSLIDWHYRTGGDISRYFGGYTPPPEKNPYLKHQPKRPSANKRYTPPNT